MFASMIGLGPHEMTVWLWVFSVGLTVVFAVLAAVSVYVAVRATGDRRPRATASRINPYPVPVVAPMRRTHGPLDDRDRTP